MDESESRERFGGDFMGVGRCMKAWTISKRVQRKGEVKAWEPWEMPWSDGT